MNYGQGMQRERKVISGAAGGCGDKLAEQLVGGATLGNRAASPIEMELGELRIQIDRLERMHEALMSRLQPLTVPYPTSTAHERDAYSGCTIGAQINDAGLRIGTLCNALDACMSSLQV